MSINNKGNFYNEVGRVCTKCNEFKSWDNFYKTDVGPNGRKSRCKECVCKKFNTQRKENKNITLERLKEVLNYNKETGEFTWKVKITTNTKIDSVAGHRDKLGYITIRIDGKTFKAHRLAWLYIYEYWPTKFLDHINRHTGDNRICNLREISVRGNIINRNKSARNTSGIVGVSWFKRDSNWAVSLKNSEKTYNLGRYATKLEAAKVRRRAEIEYGHDKYLYKSSSLEYILKHEPNFVDYPLNKNENTK